MNQPDQYELRVVPYVKSLGKPARHEIEIKDDLGWRPLKVNGRKQVCATRKQANKRIKLLQRQQLFTESEVVHGH